MRTFLLIAFLLVVFVSTAQEMVEPIYRATEVDEKPTISKGMYQLTTFISQNFNFPPIKNKKIRIFTSFIVEKDGNLSDIKAFYLSAKPLIEFATEDQKNAGQDDVDAELYEQMKAEATRVIASFPEIWNPARHDGRAVRCLFNYQIAFNLE